MYGGEETFWMDLVWEGCADRALYFTENGRFHFSMFTSREVMRRISVCVLARGGKEMKNNLNSVYPTYPTHSNFIASMTIFLPTPFLVHRILRILWELSVGIVIWLLVGIQKQQSPLLLRRAMSEDDYMSEQECRRYEYNAEVINSTYGDIILRDIASMSKAQIASIFNRVAEDLVLSS